MSRSLQDSVQHAVERAQRHGATAADAVAIDELEGRVKVRLGEIEEIQRSRQRRVGLRVLVGQRQAIVATGDLRPEVIDRLAADAVAMARLVAEDPFAGLPDPALCGAAHVQRPDLYDPIAETFDLDRGAAWAKACEAKALSLDPRFKNSEGAEFGFGSTERAFAASGGVSGSYRSSGFSGYVVPVAVDENGAMERDYWYTHRHHLADLDTPEQVAEIAAARTLRRLGGRAMPTQVVPVVFDERMASSLLGQIAGAVSAYSIYRGASYLGGKLGQSVASPLVTVVDDGTLIGAPGSRPFDGEGIPTRRTVVIERGALSSYLVDTYSGRKLGLPSTGNASRSVADAPSVAPSNLRLLPGTTPEPELLRGIAQGFYVTELIGFGTNLTTGEYSQGASGLWIENGELTHAVNEVTIAGNLLTMLQDVEAVGDTLYPNKAVTAPALRIRQLMVAGT